MSDNILKAVVASTQMNVDVDLSRVSYLYSIPSLQEFAKQINSINKIDVLLQAPLNADDFNMVIGKIISGELIQEDGQHKIVAEIGIDDPRLYYDIVSDKNDICFFPEIGVNMNLLENVALDNSGTEIKLLVPPFKIMAFNLGPKRMSSNIFLRIL